MKIRQKNGREDGHKIGEVNGQEIGNENRT